MTRDEFWFWFGVWTSILMLAGAGTVISFSDWFEPTVAIKIAKACAALAVINNVILTAAKYRGYMDAKIAAALPDPANVAKVLLVAFALSFLVAGGTAQAQGLPKLRPLTGNIANDLGVAVSDKSAAALDSIATTLAKPFNDIANFIGADADGAVSLSTVIPNLQDGHGQQCWIAMKSFGDIIKAHPVPVTFHVINDYESLRLLGIATNNLCSNVHCTQVFADFTAMAQAASPVPLAIPSLHDLCTKVPQIAVVAPVTVPAVAPVADTSPASK